MVSAPRYLLLAAFFCVCVFISSHASALAAPAGGACVECHLFMGGSLAKPVSDWEISVHAQNGITCDLCHGGNPDVPLGNLKSLSGQQLAALQARAMSKTHGFVSKPSGKAMFNICSTCHEQPVNRYEASIMGKAYLNGKGGPSCTVCHHAHNNTMPSVPKTCKKCHKDTTGFDKIDPMNVTQSTITFLSKLRIGLAERKARGARPSIVPSVGKDLGSYKTGLVAFGAVVIVFVLGYIVLSTLEKEKRG